MHFKPSHNEMMCVFKHRRIILQGEKRAIFLQMLMVTLLRGMPVELERIYCFLLFWGVGGASKKRPVSILMRVAARVTHRIIKVPYL